MYFRINNTQTRQSAYGVSTARSYCAPTYMSKTATQPQDLRPSGPAPSWTPDRNCQFSPNMARVSLVQVDLGASKGAKSQ
eukprot:2540591-Pleurochrysis_carterae.AAC.2